MDTKPVLLASLLYFAANLSAYPNIDESNIIQQFAQKRIEQIKDSLDSYHNNPYVDKQSPAERKMSVEMHILSYVLDSKNIDHARVLNQATLPTNESVNADERDTRRKAHQNVEYLIQDIEKYIKDAEAGEQLAEEINQEINSNDL